MQKGERMAQHSEPVSGGMSDPMERSGGTVARRPGMVTFAAVIMFVVAGFEVLSAILAFAGTGWWATASGDLVYANFVFWGILDLIIAALAVYAGADLLRGGGVRHHGGLPLRRPGRDQVALRHPGGPDTIGRGHRVVRDGDLRPCQIRRRGRLSALRHRDRALTNEPLAVTEAGGSISPASPLPGALLSGQRERSRKCPTQR
jgi:hypothetical protein